ncbi:alpha/beta hydrolase [Lysinibacillus sp. NPDC097231]|uniref:alpha/beta hydrolase n=1 Tax=Lysinibacillus sp. NPDC097231 TaxID=3364142 RepID=UPI0038289FA2
MLNEQLFEIVYDDKKIYGVHHRVENNILPGIVFLHGLAGDRVDSRRILVRLGRELQSMGFPSIRFDIIGTGISEGAFYDITYSYWYDQISFIVDNSVKEIWGYRPILIVAFSESGKIAIKIAKSKKQIVGLCLCNAIITSEKNQKNQNIKRLYKRGSKLVFDMGFGVWVNTEILKDNSEFIVTSKRDIPQIPILSIYSKNDDLTQESSNFIRKHKFSEFKEVSNADHLFTNPVWEKQLFDTIQSWLFKLFK